MKELSIQEKAKRYDEALKLIKECTPDENGFITIYPNEIFPELKESEDERIRKWIIGILSTYEHDRDLRNAAIAYLEKQGEQKPTIEMITPEESLGIDSETYNKIVDECIYSEQKPAEWSEGDEKILQDLIDHFEYKKEFTEAEDFNILLWLKSLKDRVQPQQEWSEEDESMLFNVIHRIEQIDHYWNKPTDEKMINWLKSLKERYTWKPSDEQMDALHYVTNFDYGGHKATLVSLYEQLKKLKA